MAFCFISRICPDRLDNFVALVIPELQWRGLFRVPNTKARRCVRIWSSNGPRVATSQIDLVRPERLTSELLDPLADGTAGALGCLAAFSSPATATVTKLKNPIARNHILPIAASKQCPHPKQTLQMRRQSV
jgi:hypothetical protein